ncbi:MAG: branched-chain amino acid ABC transporter permease [Deltaproteobacteria bacterium]|nr:branched-chain amino acid ABC transporter permease [Deltaproteobacteria bacterium]
MSDPTPASIFRELERRKRFLSGGFWIKIGLLTLFLLAPFLFPSFKSVDLMIKIIIFATLVASFDILLGYTGIISFGHGMFFGIGAYCLGFFLSKYGSPSYLNIILAFSAAIVVSFLLALFISFLSLRIKAIFFAMITLALAEFSLILAMKLSRFTGGEDGISISLPGIFTVSTDFGRILGLDITGRIVTYYFILLICLGLFLMMLRFTRSPLGRVLQAIRDNVQRAEALGYSTFIYQIISITFGCIVASVVGGLYALWVRYINPESCLSTVIVLDVLIMVIIGGMGTLYGSFIGAAFLQMAQTFLPDLQKFAKTLFPHADLLHNAMERWLLIFGILFILIVFFFPRGVMGTIQEITARRKAGRAS